MHMHSLRGRHADSPTGSKGEREGMALWRQQEQEASLLRPETGLRPLLEKRQAAHCALPRGIPRRRPREPFAQSPARPTAKCGRGARRGADVQLARRSEAAAALAADLLLPPLVHALTEAAHRIGHAALLPAGRSAEGGANGSASGHISATPRGNTPRWLHLGCPRTRRPPPCRVRAHLNSVLTTRPAEARRATARARAPTRRRAAAAPGRGARASVRSRATARPVPTGTPPRPVVGACVVGRSACGRL